MILLSDIRGNIMKSNNQKGVARTLAKTALSFSKISANSRCMSIFHQPKKPDNLQKLRKF